MLFVVGEQANPQHSAPVNPTQLAKETEVLSRESIHFVLDGDLQLASLDAHVTLDLARLIQKSRIDINMSQKDFAVVGPIYNYIGLIQFLPCIETQ